MNCLLFSSDIYVSDGESVKVSPRGLDLNGSLDPSLPIRLCYVDIDVLIGSAPENYLEKKDVLLAQKFKDTYTGEYITLNEKIDCNLFQVFGIKSERLREVYSCLPAAMVEVFIPYAIALRAFLVHCRVDMRRTFVVVDDLGDEKLLTVFDGMKFSRTRTIYNRTPEEILPDIKRSVIDFNKKLGEFALKNTSGTLVILCTDRILAEALVFLEPGIAVECLDCKYPSLKGLAFIDSTQKYRVPEAIILEKKQELLRVRLKHVIASIVICLSGALFFGFNQLSYSCLARDFKTEQSKNGQLVLALGALDQKIYRGFLRRAKNINYASLFLEFSSLLPSTYDIASFKFADDLGRWNLETTLFAQDDQFYDEIPRVKILKNAVVKDVFIKNRPGKYLRVSL